MANDANALHENALSAHYSNWTINKMPLRWTQCLASDSIPFNEIVSIPAISQNTALANGQYAFSMAIFLMILLLYRRATTSITKDVDTLKDLIALLKLLHWKNCDYSNVAFTVTCFLIFMGVLPLLLTMWLFMLCYRHYIHYMIKVSWSDFHSILWQRILRPFLKFDLISVHHPHLNFVSFNFRIHSKNMVINFVIFWMGLMQSGHLKMILQKVS